MRKFTEPTARNLLRKPLVLGVPFEGLLALAFVSLGVFVFGGGRGGANATALLIGGIGYIGLRVFSRFAKAGWEENVFFAFERVGRRRPRDGILDFEPLPEWTIAAPDTLTETDLLNLKDSCLEQIRALRPGAQWVLALRSNERGASPSGVRVTGELDARQILAGDSKVYSLYRLPVVTDPLWLFGVIRTLPAGSTVCLRFEGVDGASVKKRVEHARRSNSHLGGGIADMDSVVSFEEASLVLQGLSRGDEAVVEVALVVIAPQALEVDPSLFCLEKKPELAVLSVVGARKRFHRSHLVRAVTACDLIPNVCDTAEDGTPILRNLRGGPLYFWPQDPRLEALHWLVVGASGSGKSFFTGLVLKRMIEQGAPMSVLFVDHHRSFRRLVRSSASPYLEPKSLREVEAGCANLFDHWERVGTLSGIELSDLDLEEKKAAVHALLSRFELFLRHRQSTHPVYLVLDECWNFMRDEPVLVQRAFREFRKLNGAVVAITQSLADFLTDESGQSIFQNAPIRILLRQGEDVSRYQGILSLNPVEAARVSRLRQQRGVYSECLIKTPFLSRLGRLYPTADEHALLRTDNLRAELVAESRKEAFPCAKSLG